MARFLPGPIMDGILAGYTSDWTVSPCAVELDDGETVYCYRFRMDGPDAPDYWGAPDYCPPFLIIPAEEIESATEYAAVCRTLDTIPIPAADDDVH